MTEPPAAAVLAPPVTEPCWFSLAPRPESIGLGRRFARDVIAGHVTDPDHAHTVVLLASELMTNALRAAQNLLASGRVRWKPYHRPLRLGLVVTGRYVHLLATDPDPAPLVPGPVADEFAETGRGLGIVGVLGADLWVTYSRYDKTVHAAVAAPGVTLSAAELAAIREQS